MTVSVFRESYDRNGNTIFSNTIVVDEIMLSNWLLNRVVVPDFDNEISMIEFITGLSVLTEPISSDIFGPIDFFYDKNKTVLKKFELPITLPDKKVLRIKVDKYDPWNDELSGDNRLLQDILQEEKKEKLEYDAYSSYRSNSRYNDEYLFDNLCVDPFINFITEDFIRKYDHDSIKWTDHENIPVNYEGDNLEYWYFSH